MNEVKILICGNYEKNEIINSIENLKIKFNLNLLVKDCSEFTYNQNIEEFFSLIDNRNYFNAFILNYEKKEEIFKFFKLFNSEESGITNECYPFFVFNEKIISRKEANNFIKDLNKSKDEEYKFNFGNFYFFTKIKEEFQYNILKIYNCYKQENIKLHEEAEEKETINILVIGIKNSGKTFLINKLLWETRALSMENRFTTKLNSYQHSKYPIVFYDISGFNENEDEELRDINSKIQEFCGDYKNIKNKIHIIFYVIDCNNARIFQKKEKELIENIFEINIPIFIVGQKAKKTNIKNFIRKTNVELETFSEKYNEKIENLKNRIFCLDTKESLIKLLKSVNMEFIESKAYNEKIINSSSIMNNDELINRSFSDNFMIINSYDEEQFIKDFFEWVKKSIFFNKYIETLKEIYNNILKIKEKYINKNYYFSNLDIQSINDDIKKEFLKIISEEDLKEINKIIYEQQKKDLDENNIEGFKIIQDGSGIVGFFSLFLFLCNPYFLIGIPLFGGINYLFFRARKKK